MSQHFPCTRVLLDGAQELNGQLDQATGNKWYLNLPFWLASVPFFMLGLTASLFADAMVHLGLIFNIRWRDVVNLKEYLQNEVPEGIQKIALTIAIAATAIFALSLLSGSVYFLLAMLQLSIAIAAVTHIVLVIQENIPKLQQVAEAVYEKMPAMPSREQMRDQVCRHGTTIYNKLPNNPFRGLFYGYTSHRAADLSGLGPANTTTTAAQSRKYTPT